MPLVEPSGDKSLVVLAIEKVGTKKGKESIGRAYSRTIDDGSGKGLQTIIDRHISKNINITAGKWRGYALLQKEPEDQTETKHKGEAIKMVDSSDRVCDALQYHREVPLSPKKYN